MAALDQPFTPRRGSNQVVTSTTPAAAVTIDATDTSLRVVNTGANKAYVMTYLSTEAGPPVASATEHVVAAGMSTTIGIPFTHNRVSHFSVGGTTLEISTGTGLF